MSRQREPMMIRADTPCPKCGDKQRFTLIDMSNPDVEAFPLIPVCVRCRHRFPAEASA